eukprot:1784499-Rhodomonas_salina.1
MPARVLKTPKTQVRSTSLGGPYKPAYQVSRPQYQRSTRAAYFCVLLRICYGLLVLTRCNGARAAGTDALYGAGRRY